jgi:hypothetical protein
MKLILILFTNLIIFLTGCSYKVTRYYNVPENKTNKLDCECKIVLKKDMYGINCKYKGRIKLDDSGVSINCTQKEAFEILKNEACILDANLINIVDFIEPGESSCYRCIADFYSIQYNELSNNILEKNNRDTLKYLTRSKLKWEDLKIIIPEDSLIPYKIYKNFEMYSDMDAWVGTYKNFRVKGVLYLDVSGVKRSFINDSNLNHIQLIFDLTQIYSRKLEQYGKRQKIQEIVNEFLNKLEQEAEKYSQETEYGKNIEEQNRWIKKVETYKKEFNIN